MIPVISLGKWIFAVGPFKVDMENNAVSARPWPVWIDQFCAGEPDGILMHQWLPVAYTSLTDGGAWAIQTRNPRRREGNRAIRMLFLNNKGELQRDMVIRNPRLDFPEILAFGRHLFAFGAFIKHGALLEHDRSLEEKKVEMIRNRMVCMGENGQIVFPDGEVWFPNQDFIRYFNSRSVFDDICDMIRVLSHCDPDQSLGVLSWDCNKPWFYVRMSGWYYGGYQDGGEHQERIHGIAAGIYLSPYRSPKWGVFIQEAVRIGYSTTGTDCSLFHLPDGGWVVFVTERSQSDASKIIRQSLIFRMPGCNQTNEFNLEKIQPFSRFRALGFFYHPPDGLSAILEERNITGRESIIFWVMRGKEWRVAPIMRTSLEVFMNLMGNGWFNVWRDGEPLGVLFACGIRPEFAPRGCIFLPNSATTGRHFLNVPLPANLAPPKGDIHSPPVIDVVFRWENTLVARYYDPSRNLTVFSSLLADRSRLDFVPYVTVSGRVGDVLHVEKGKSLAVVMSGEEGSANPVLLVHPDGNLSISMTGKS